MKIKGTPPQNVLQHLKGVLVVRYTRWGTVIQAWPRKRGRPKSSTTQAQVAAWDLVQEFVRAPEANDYSIALAESQNTAFYARDTLSMAAYGNYLSWPGWGWRAQTMANIQDLLNSICDTDGAILYNAAGVWVCLDPGTASQLLTLDATTLRPVWADQALDAINELTGDVTAGPGTGSQVATLTDTGATAGSYTLASITIDSKGRILTASNGSPPGAAMLPLVNGDINSPASTDAYPGIMVAPDGQCIGIPL